MKALLGERRLWWAVGLAAVGVAGVAVWVVLRAGGEPARERQYRAETACLLTGDQGIRGPVAAPIWTGMQRASLDNRIQVSFLAVSGAQTAQNASTHLAGRWQGHCDLLLAVDAVPVAAVGEAAAR